MAQVTPYTRQIADRPINQTTVAVRTSSAAFGGDMGGALRELGRGVTAVADAKQTKDLLTADADARDAFTRYRETHNNLLRAPGEGFLNQTGGNARGIEETGQEALSRAADEIGSELSPAARARYDRSVAELQSQGQNQLLGVASNEERNYIVNQREATIQGYMEEASTNYNNEPLFEQNLGNAMAEQRELAALQGWDPATLDQAEDQMVSTAYRQRIVQTAVDNPLRAQEMLEANAERLTAEDEYALRTGLEEEVREYQVNGFLQEYTSFGTPAGTVRRDGSVVVGQDGLPAIEGLTFTQSLGPARPNMPDNEVLDVVGQAAVATFGPGTTIRISSGQETDDNGNGVIDPEEQHGSDRHGTGLAVDFAVIRPDGTQVRATDPDANQFAFAAARAGALGIGFGMEYMGGDHFHVDMTMPGGGQNFFWASGARAIGPELVQMMDISSGRALQQAGFPATRANRDLVTRMGSTEALRLLSTAQMTPSMSAELALGPEVMAANPNFAGMTVGEVMDSMSAATGDSPAVVQQNGPYFDAQAAYAAALRIEDPATQQAALAAISNRMQMQDRINAQERQEAQESAWDQYATTGRTEFPPEFRAQMGQSGWTSFQNAVQQDMAGIDATDPDTHELLTRLASDDPVAFSNTNLQAHYGNLSQADRRHFVQLQENTERALEGGAAEAEGARRSIDYGAHYRAADEVYGALVDSTSVGSMDDEQRQRRLRFQQQLTSMIDDFYQRENREPNVSEVREMSSVLATPIIQQVPGNLFTGGWDRVNEGIDGALFDAANRADGMGFQLDVSYGDIPIADRTRIAGMIMQTNGGTVPSEDEIVEAYEQQRMIGVGLTPAVDIGTVPEWLIEIERADNPNITDDELVERYQLFLMTR